MLLVCGANGKFAGATIAHLRTLLPAGTRFAVGTRTPDPAIPVDLIMLPRTASLRHVLSNSFGFGGSNASLVLSRRGA